LGRRGRVERQRLGGRASALRLGFTPSPRLGLSGRAHLGLAPAQRLRRASTHFLSLAPPP